MFRNRDLRIFKGFRDRRSIRTVYIVILNFNKTNMGSSGESVSAAEQCDSHMGSIIRTWTRPVKGINVPCRVDDAEVTPSLNKRKEQSANSAYEESRLFPRARPFNTLHFLSIVQR